MRKRDGKDIWKELYDFYAIETKRRQSIQKLIEEPVIKKIVSKRSVLGFSKPYKHTLSHQNIHAKFIIIDNPRTLPKVKGLDYYTKEQIANLPKPILIQRFLVDQNIL
jgi:A/G-specific adenine glycosylase